MGLSRILVADADPEGLRRLVDVVTAAGCRAIEAKDGLRALETFARERPDAVIVDAALSGVGGLHVVTEVRRSTPGHWVPVILTTTERGQEAVARAIEAGADQVLHKPFGLELLQAHLANFGRVLGLEEELRDRNEGLEEYRRHSEEEEKLAKSMLDGMLGIDAALAGHVRTWVGPAERFSGDIVLAERTPSGATVAFLGDVTGHGLAAAFGSMPVIRTFTAMARKGFSLGAIASELNSAAYNNLRRDQFIAGTLALFDPDTGMLEVWNGGNPAVPLIDEECRLRARFRSEHLPLGILSPRDFDARTKVVLVESPCQLAMVSDGMTEQRDASGRRVGELGLLDLLQATAGPARLAMLRAKYTDIGVREDDCSVLLLDCRPGPRGTVVARPLVEVAEGERAVPDGREADWEFTLRLSVETLRRADAVPLVTQLVANLQPPGFEPGRLHVVLAELFNNALDHGLLHLDSRLKDNPDGFQIWMDEREARLNRISAGSIEVTIAALRGEEGASRFRVRVSDTGKGFDPAKVGTAKGLSHGRGIALVRSLAESLDYRAGGASAEVVCAA